MTVVMDKGRKGTEIATVMLIIIRKSDYVGAGSFFTVTENLLLEC